MSTNCLRAEMSEDLSQEFINFSTLVQGDSSLRDRLVACQDLD